MVLKLVKIKTLQHAIVVKIVSCVGHGFVYKNDDSLCGLLCWLV